MSTYLKTLTKRRIRWENLSRKNTDFTNVNSTLKRYIRKGIPGKKIIKNLNILIIVKTKNRAVPC